jgi:HAMP domain-containing protein
MVDVDSFILEYKPSIMILTETWTKPNLSFNPDVHGYTTIHFPRLSMHKKAKRNSGGIMIFYQNDLSHCFSVVKVNQDRVWLKLGSENQDLYICGTYIPPYSSTSMINNDPPWLEIMSEISYYNTLGFVLLFGDLNARTGLFVDFYSDCDPLYFGETSLNSNEELPIPVLPLPEQYRSRASQDNICNSYGKDLIEVCKATGTIICNGRFPPDGNNGQYTCHTSNGSSCVDYALASYHSLARIQRFEVLALHEISNHCPIALSFQLLHPTKTLDSLNRDYEDMLIDNLIKRQSLDTPLEPIDSVLHIKWDKRHFNNFKSRLVEQDPPNMNADDPLDSKVESFSRAILDIARRCGYGIPVQRSGNPCTVTKHNPKHFKWFDDECKSNKLEVHQKMKRWRQNHSDSNLRREYFEAKAKWKKIIRRKKTDGIKAFNKEVKRSSIKNPKHFWKLFSTSKP